MTEAGFYQIGELAERTGVTPRTIRYYTAEGLLPPPDTRGRYALYGEDHVLRLQLITRLKEAYLPLTEIKARIEQLATEQVRRLLTDSDPALEQRSGASAADYVAQVLAGQPTLPARKLAEVVSYYDAKPADALEAQPQVASAAPQAVRESAPAARPVPLQIGAAMPLAAPDAPPVPAPPAPEQGSLLRRLIPQRRERVAPAAVAAQAEAEQTWRRVSLAPGVELHVREPAEPGLRERVERLIASARSIFEER
jgi:DNA-binding transcriptional MerR regulator